MKSGGFSTMLYTRGGGNRGFLQFKAYAKMLPYSVPYRDKWSKRTGRILAEYYLRIQFIRPLGSGTTLGLHLSTSLDLRFHLFPQPMCHQQSQRSSGHLL